MSTIMALTAMAALVAALAASPALAIAVAENFNNRRGLFHARPVRRFRAMLRTKRPPHPG